MVSLAQLVDDSLLRHGVETTLDPRRLQWSAWFHIESCFSFLRVPDHAGIYALAEEIIAPGGTAATDGKRMLAIYRIAEAEHLGLAMGRLFLPGRPEVKRLAGNRCFARYAVIEDESQRNAAFASLQRWISSSTATVLNMTSPSEASPAAESSNEEELEPAQIGPPVPFPAGF